MNTNKDIQEHAQAALSEVDAILKLIAEMQDDDWPGQGAPSSELASHWFAAYGRCTDRAKKARAILATRQPAPVADDADAYTIKIMGELLAAIAVTLKGPEAAMHRHSYHDLPKLVAELKLAADLEAAPVASTPAVAVQEPRIPGLGRMTDDDDGYITLQFKDEKSASKFMEDYAPSIDVEEMPPQRRDAKPDVKAMVDRFLGWKLPEDFWPDAGISFDRSYSAKWGMPIGTNLLTADQAKAMFEYCLAAPQQHAQAAQPCTTPAECNAQGCCNPLGRCEEALLDQNMTDGLPQLPDALQIDWPMLNRNALGCGVEDRGIHDRYDAAEYGWRDGVDRAVDCVPEQIYDADQVRTYGHQCRAAALEEAAKQMSESGYVHHATAIRALNKKGAE